MNSLQFLEETFPKCDFSKQRSPSYIEFLSLDTHEIILVTKKKPKSSGNVKRDKNESVGEPLDLTGSPLKLELSLNLEDTLITNVPKFWTEEEASHEPITVDDARTILKQYNEYIQTGDSTNAATIWAVTSKDENLLLLTQTPQKDSFVRGIVTYEGNYEFIDMGKLIEEHSEVDRVNVDQILCNIECEYQINGVMQRKTSECEDLLIGHHLGGTNLKCKWNNFDLEVPLRSAVFELIQEVVVGHHLSKCHKIWRSITSFHSLNQILVDVAAASRSNIDIESIPIRQWPTLEFYSQEENETRLKELLQNLETYNSWLPPSHHEECVHLGQVLDVLADCIDFTYSLWDIVKDSSTVEEMLKLLLQALKFVSGGKFKPIIHPQNKTQLSKLVLNLSRGLPQADKLLKTLRSNPVQALTLLAQVANDKLCWEFNKVLTRIDHSFDAESLLTARTITQEGIDQLNQSINEMSIGGDLNFNPFQKSYMNETSLRISTDASLLDCTSTQLNVNEFESLKKSGLINPLDAQAMSSEELDVGRWKINIRTFAQLYVCLEHLMRIQQALRLDFASLSNIWSSLKEQILSQKSPIRGVGQLINDPLHSFKTNVRSHLVADHIKNKSAIWYNIRLYSKEEKETKRFESIVSTYLFSQQSVFPPSIWRDSDLESSCINENSYSGYYCNKYLHITNRIPNYL